MIEYIRQHKDDIRKHQQGAMNWWNNRTGMPYDQVLTAIEPDEKKRKSLTLTRQKIIELYKQDPYRGFMATMLWGGKDKTGLEAIIKHNRDGEDGLDNKLERVKNYIQQGEIRKAYISMCKGGVSDETKSNCIKYVGPAFFTKVFYFLSKAFATSNTPIPLILDSHMCYVHCALLLDEPHSKQSFYKWHKTKDGKDGLKWNHQTNEFIADVYMDYIERMSRIAEMVSCSADTLEAYLFDLKPGNKKSFIYKEVKEKLKKSVREDTLQYSTLMISTINANSSQNEIDVNNRISAHDFQLMTHNHGTDHVFQGYTFKIKDIHFWLFVAFEYENPRIGKKRRGYYCELLNQSNNTDITNIPEVSLIFNKYRNYDWIPTNGKKYKYVFFGREDTNKTDALHLMKSILKDINAPMNVINSIECE